MAKEKLSFNRIPATLFVGVGGIGSEIITRVAERSADGELENLRFVAMDTDVNSLRGVKGSKARLITVQTSSTQSVLDYLKNDDDARLNWFPNNTTLYPKTVSEGAGQVRAISRLALNATIRSGNIAKLYKAIDDLFLKDGEDVQQALRVVIVSSACGGTGSGIAMAVGMLIREYLHKHYREKSAIIRGFLLLPGVMDTVIGTEAERVSLRRNGYATIKEINAFMIKASGFCGVRKDLERYDALHIDVPTTTEGVDRLDNLPFDFCFLLDRIDQSQVSMQTLEQYKEFAAQSLYEQNIGPMQRRAFSMEDNIIKEFANGDNLGRNRFGGIGASVLRYPYEDVADYIAYTRAMDRIGAGEESGSWLKYDQKFKEATAEFKKKRSITNTAAPVIADVYVSSLQNDEQRFGVDIKAYLITPGSDVVNSVADKVDMFISAFKNEIRSSFVTLPEVSAYETQVSVLKQKKDYESNENDRGHAAENLESIRMYEHLVKSKARTTANARAKSILYTAPSVAQDVEGYNLETLVKTSGGAMHPNAIRYMLYSLQQKLKEEQDRIHATMKRKSDAVDVYAPNADNPNLFDVNGGASKEEEHCLDEVIALEKEDVGLLEKIGMKKVWDAFNKHLPAYSNAVLEYRDSVLFAAAFDIALEYVERLNREFESFYNSFSAKVVSLGKAKDDIVDKLRFKKGDSTTYILGEKKHLDRLAVMCPEGSEGLLLPEELNADIFEAVKKNAESARLAAYDPYGDNPRTDIFDSVLIDYFRESVRSDCDEIINLNIFKAIDAECAFNAFFDENSGKSEDDEIVVPEITKAQKDAYRKKCILFGKRLAASGIGFSTFKEPREVSVCAFNKGLLKLRDLDIKTELESIPLAPQDSDTVSKYDLRFFNALYNITPDQLARFKAPESSNGQVGYGENAGIYFDAYHEYIKKIGPDSTKSSTISLHIDKRWDSLTEMEELSMDTHYMEMVKIHSALIYGVVYSMIKTHPSSRFDAKKRIFALEDTEGDLTILIVSNGTECDEFYEVLDALYRDRASVAKIYEMSAERHKFDVEYNRRYSETAFFKAASEFRIGDGHTGKTSLFEIPLMYYNSLPRAKLDDNELAIMIDSVIGVIGQEVERYEQEADRAPILSRRLEQQFRLLIDNFNNDEYNQNDELRKNSDIGDNRVINMVLKKVSNKIKELNTFEFEAKVEELRKLVRS
ncbi:MAG: tubulin-like doman-containing protein [Clostridia bacterium]|nr:tubulin-like doman-containing protein [Clostridia bacterium]